MRPTILHSSTFTLVLALLISACGGSTSAPAANPYDGAYSATVGTVTPAGTAIGTATFSVANSSVSDPGATFVGTVSSSGAFTGTSIVCQGCSPLSITGTFSRTDNFTLTGSSGSVSQTIAARASSLTPRYQVIWNAVGGGAASTSPDRPTFAPGEAVLLNPIPNAGRAFIRWTGDCTGAAPPCRLTMDRSKIVTIFFDEAVVIFDGSYTGSYSGDGSGAISATISRGVITVTAPGSGSGTISATGGATFGGFAPGNGAACAFTGTFQLTTAGGVTGSGSWSCTITTAGITTTGTGTWTAARNS